MHRLNAPGALEDAAFFAGFFADGFFAAAAMSLYCVYALWSESE